VPESRIAACLRTSLFVVLSLASSALQAWGIYGGVDGAHYAPLSQIDRGNVAQLRPAWEFNTGELAGLDAEERALYSFQGSPIRLPEAAGGQLVICTPLSRVIALDALSGTALWRFDPQIERARARPFNCRGVAYWDSGAAGHCRHRILLGSYDRRLIAIDAGDGKRCAGFGVNGEVDMMDSGPGHARAEVTHPSPPAVIGDVVVVGSGVVDFTRADAPPGAVQAFDARDGSLRWRFDPVPTAAVPGEWPDDPQRASGAANVWAPITVDHERDVVFLATSSPSPDYYGAARPGDNRHANSVVALRASSGELLWSYQMVHHDLWDYDLPAQPILTDVVREGQRLPALIQLTKQGFVFLLHRDTGVPLWPVQERAVPASVVPGERAAPTQPFPLLPRPLLPDTLAAADAWGFTPWDRGRCAGMIRALRHQGLFTPVGPDWTLMLPGSLGAANWGGAGLDPVRRLLLLNINTVPARARLVRHDSAAVAGSVSIEGYDWRMVMSGTPYAMETGMLVSPLGAPCSAPPWGALVALDLDNGQWRWRVPLGSIHEMGPVPLPFEINLGTPNLGGGLLTAGGLFFIGATLDRRLRAFDVETGEVLWRAGLPADAHATPVSYLADGRQFVVVAAGGHHMFGNRRKGDSIVGFALPR